MTSDGNANPRHSPTREPKFCRCRVCHEYFYASTIAKAQGACLEHGRAEHPDWDQDTVCYCPD